LDKIVDFSKRENLLTKRIAISQKQIEIGIVFVKNIITHSKEVLL